MQGTLFYQVAENNLKGAAKDFFWLRNLGGRTVPILAISGRKGAGNYFPTSISFFMVSLQKTKKTIFGIVNLVLRWNISLPNPLESTNSNMTIHHFFCIWQQQNSQIGRET